MYNCHIFLLILRDSSNVFPKNDKIKEYTLSSELTIDYAPYLSTHIYLIYDRFLKYSRCGVNHQSINYSNHTKLYTDVQIFLLSKCIDMNGFENVLTSFIGYLFPDSRVWFS